MERQKRIQADLVGTYTLDSFEIEDPDGIRKAWRTNARGLLIYTDDGHMSVAINSDIDPAALELGGEQSHFEAVLDSILFYAGRFQVEDGSLVRHYVAQASNPDRIGKELIRYADWDSGRLKLTTPNESFGRAILVWRRVNFLGGG